MSSIFSKSFPHWFLLFVCLFETGNPLKPELMIQQGLLANELQGPTYIFFLSAQITGAYSYNQLLRECRESNSSLKASILPTKLYPQLYLLTYTIFITLNIMFSRMFNILFCTMFHENRFSELEENI